MRSRMACSLGLLAVALALAPASAQEALRVKMRVPESRFEEVAIDAYGEPEVLIEGWEEEERKSVPMKSDLGPGLVVALDAEVKAAGGSISEIFDHPGGEILVTGSAEAVALVEARIAAIDHFLQGRATLRIAAIHCSERADVADAASVRAAAESGRAEVLLSGRMQALRGEPVVREVLESRTYVHDLSVEVAIGASIADAEMATLVTGVRLAVQQRPVDSRSTVVTVSFHLSHVDETETIEVTSGTLSRPHVSFVSATTPMLVEKGTPQAIVLDHPWKPGFVAVLVEALELPEFEELPFRLVDYAALSATGADLPWVTLGLYDDESGPPEGWRSTLFARAEEWGLGLEFSDAGVTLTPSVAIVRDPAYLLPVLRPTALVRRTWRMDQATLAGLEAYDPLENTLPREVLTTLADRPPRIDLRVPTLVGGRMQIVAGKWFPLVAGYSVEIAQSAAITDPTVSTFLAGDLIQGLSYTPRAGSPLAVEFETVRVLGIEIKPIVVRKDIEGKRSEESGDRVDIVRHRRTAGRVVVEDATPLSLRRVGDAVEIDAWERE